MQPIFEQIHSFFDAQRSRSPVESARSSFAENPVRSVDWVIPGKLALGGLPRPGDERSFAHHQIGAILSLCDECEGSFSSTMSQLFRHYRCVLPDSHYAIALTPRKLGEAVEIVHHSLRQGEPIYVHCLAGMERSPTVCIAYLCRYCRQDFWEAASWVKQVRAIARPTEEQLQVAWEYCQGMEIGR